MPNFFTDNEDIQFLFEHLDLHEIASVQEDGFVPGDGPGSEYAPIDADDAIDNYRRILGIVGEVSGSQIAPRAGEVDSQGHTLMDNGTVEFCDGVRANLAAHQLLAAALPTLPVPLTTQAMLSPR